MVRSIVLSTALFALIATVCAVPTPQLADVDTQDIGVKDVYLDDVLTDVVDINDLDISNNLNGIDVLSSNSPDYMSMYNVDDEITENACGGGCGGRKVQKPPRPFSPPHHNNPKPPRQASGCGGGCGGGCCQSQDDLLAGLLKRSE